jgi:hypothetical protein
MLSPVILLKETVLHVETTHRLVPFIVISCGKVIFCTLIIRHNQSGTKKLLFHICEYESTLKVQLIVLDLDTLSRNNHVRDTSVRMEELVVERVPTMMVRNYFVKRKRLHQLPQLLSRVRHHDIPVCEGFGSLAAARVIESFSL